MATIDKYEETTEGWTIFSLEFGNFKDEVLKVIFIPWQKLTNDFTPSLCS